MRQLFQHIARELPRQPLVLVTVVAASGATPRGMGARMLVSAEGRLCGTIGGGAVEYRALETAQRVLTEAASVCRDFALHKDDVQNLGMICGGEVQVFFHYLPMGDHHTLQLTERIEAAYAQSKDLWLLSDLGSDGTLGIYTPADGICGLDWADFKPSRHPVRWKEGGRDLYAEQIATSGKVYVFGCGHVAQELVPLLSHVGFRCIALDDRPEFADPALFPTAEQVLPIDFERIADTVTVGAEDYVCVMTRGHAYDTAVQAQLLNTPACYIGVIGSIHKRAGVFRILHGMGFTEDDTNRIITPIGLDIGGETPAEIAVSIAAQMIRHRADRSGQ